MWQQPMTVLDSTFINS